MKPFKYQEKAIDKTVASLEEHGRALVVMAPGLGKTVVASFVALKQLVTEGRVLVLCHENKILEQNLNQFSEILGSEYTYGLFTGEQKDCHEVDFLFASFQTMRTWKDAFHDDEFGSLVVDEGHHSMAASYEATILYFNPKYKVALTGTPDRTDELDIRSIFGNEVVDISLAEGIAKGWLVDVEYHLITDTFNNQALKRMLKGILDDGKRVSIKQLNETIFVKARDDEVAAQIISRQAKQTIVFCESILHAENFVKFLPGAETYHSGRGASVNTENLESFKQGKISYLLVVNKLNEGVDIPSADMVVFLRSTDSKTIFFQQLGRGLRRVPGKEKVIILDFVGNVDRIVMVSDMAKEISLLAECELDRNPIYLSGEAFEFYFTDLQVDLLKALERMSVDFYPTLKEASRAAIAMGIKSVSEYLARYREDPRLPSNPNVTYKSEWKGYISFFGGTEKDFYPTLAEASEVARREGADSILSYLDIQTKDPRLPSRPQFTYKDEWKDWYYFLTGKAKELYHTLNEASVATQNLNITSQREYRKRFHEDSRLPSSPNNTYKDEWKGWYFLFGREKKTFYITLSEASKVAQTMGIKNKRDYKKRYKEDKKLPGDPDQFYKSEWVSWEHFLGKDFYPTLVEASEVVQAMKIESYSEYKKRYKEDKRLTSVPYFVYKSEWVSWYHFFGKPPKDYYPTMGEASRSAISLEIKTGKEYVIRHKEDPGLPYSPAQKYKKEWKGWPHFLGKK